MKGFSSIDRNADPAVRQVEMPSTAPRITNSPTLPTGTAKGDTTD